MDGMKIGMLSSATKPFVWSSLTVNVQLDGLVVIPAVTQRKNWLSSGEAFVIDLFR
ncbi:hypothetical protein AVEN_31555-1, partial [Araneus ventricosus]